MANATPHDPKAGTFDPTPVTHASMQSNAPAPAADGKHEFPAAFGKVPGETITAPPAHAASGPGTFYPPGTTAPQAHGQPNLVTPQMAEANSSDQYRPAMIQPNPLGDRHPEIHDKGPHHQTPQHFARRGRGHGHGHISHHHLRAQTAGHRPHHSPPTSVAIKPADTNNSVAATSDQRHDRDAYATATHSTSMNVASRDGRRDTNAYDPNNIHDAGISSGISASAKTQSANQVKLANAKPNFGPKPA